ncbi:hypothetical protein KIN20_018350 [Parelaphostrongylus tenuis]|uniref:Hexosyltransferase n=1 Tax=Parelaphostrongylus tenuis TaxID=148309 RepID=A0AAD5MJT5_PARTN|nr:hypothetical protein KIN20_018350 [Parelaphostrongylus tenuis]
MFAVSPLHRIRISFQEQVSIAQICILVDDDYMVNVISLLRLVSKKDPSKPLYEGWMFDTTPFRFRFHKHAVSLAMYPFDRYPPYITAGAVLLSHNSVAQFHHAIQCVKIYPYDDVYAGILAYLLRIPPTHNKAFVFWSRHVNKEDWIRGDVIAAHGYSPSQLIEEFPSTMQNS